MTAPTDFMAEEDFEFLNAIANNLAKEHGIFEIMLVSGVRLTNKGEDRAIRFAGLDQIKDARDKIIIASGALGKYQLVMNSKLYEKPTKVGEIFDMPVMADPSCPADRFLIKPVGMGGSNDKKNS